MAKVDNLPVVSMNEVYDLLTNVKKEIAVVNSVVDMIKHSVETNNLSGVPVTCDLVSSNLSKIENGSIVAIEKAIKSLNVEQAVVTETPKKRGNSKFSGVAIEDKPKRKRRTKAEIEADNAKKQEEILKQFKAQGKKETKEEKPVEKAVEKTVEQDAKVEEK